MNLQVNPYQAKEQKTKNPQNIILILNYSRVDKKKKKKKEETLLSSLYQARIALI